MSQENSKNTKRPKRRGSVTKAVDPDVKRRQNEYYRSMGFPKPRRK